MFFALSALHNALANVLLHYFDSALILESAIA